ncbi:Uncharacterised protein [Actinobacillus equuli]|nr:Uncharacterised protein [Actinobacillus equuli]
MMTDSHKTELETQLNEAIIQLQQAQNRYEKMNLFTLQSLSITHKISCRNENGISKTLGENDENSDFIQMTQCAMYSIKFPHDKFVETIETASYPDRGDGFSVEVVTNPLTGNKVQLLGEGYFLHYVLVIKNSRKRCC